MFTTLMIGNDITTCDTIRGTIEQYCKGITFHGMTSDPVLAPTKAGRAPDMIFWDAQGPLASQHVAADSFPTGVINVLLLDQPLPSRPVQAGHQRDAWISVNTCLYKPLHIPDLLITLSNGRNMVELRRAFQTQHEILEQIRDQQSNPGIVGIPTEDGMDFLPAREIVRCEGLNKYTLIVTTQKTQLLSSYNIGEFAKTLHLYGFFSPHKSHLINLRCIRRLTVENQIILYDGSQVPLSRRRRLEFIQRFRANGA